MNEKIIKKMLYVLVIVIVIAGAFFIYELMEGKSDNDTTVPPVTSTSTAIVYINRDYGFSLDLPDSWKGYTMTNGLFQSFDGKTNYGYTVTLRNPKWTAKNPTMDIPIQIFSLDQWNKWVATNFDGYPTAAPIGPTERGRNGRYVFATAPRYNYSFMPGFEEVENIIKNIKTF